MSNGAILLVDDDREMVDSISNWFRRVGYETTPTYHAFHCLMAAAENQYDVAIVDVGMPDMNGFEVLRELVALQLFPVIVLSGHNGSEFKSRAFQLGALEYLVKPVSLPEVEAVVRKAIQGDRFGISKSQSSYTESSQPGRVTSGW